jgi:hypothetical protein
MFDAGQLNSSAAHAVFTGVRRSEKFPKQNGRRPVRRIKYLKAQMQSRHFYDLEFRPQERCQRLRGFPFAGTFSAIGTRFQLIDGRAAVPLNT